MKDLRRKWMVAILAQRDKQVIIMEYTMVLFIHTPWLKSEASLILSHLWTILCISYHAMVVTLVVFAPNQIMYHFCCQWCLAGLHEVCNVLASS